MSRAGIATQPSGTARRVTSVRGRKPRIVQVVPSLQVGGLQKIVVRLVQHLHGRADHLVVTPSGDGPLRRELPADVAVVPMAGTRLSGKLNVLGMARIFRRFRPDIVHTRNWTCVDAILAARLVGVPVVIHGEHGREADDPDGHNRFRRHVRRCLAPMVTEFVTVSRDLSRWLAEDVGIRPDRITHIYNGVDIDAFAPTNRHEARRRLGIADGEIVIGTVGRLDPIKDHEGLLHAFSRLPGPGRCRLVIIGDGPVRPEIEELRRALRLEDRVSLLGERSDVRVLLPGLDIFTLPSLGEGISNAILEAMASGLPVVATRVGGNVELVVDNVTGLLVERRSKEALTVALSRYLDEPGLVVGQGNAGRLRAITHFSLDRMFGAYEALYARLLTPGMVA